MFKFNFSIPETMYEKYGWDFETDWDLDITGFRVYGKTQRITMQVIVEATDEVFSVDLEGLNPVNFELVKPLIACARKNKKPLSCVEVVCFNKHYVKFTSMNF